MNTSELARRLVEEGCNPANYAIGERGSVSDAFCLTHDGAQWQVFYTERGIDRAPFFTSTDEAEACQYFFDYVTRFRHDHYVGFFRNEALAQGMIEALTECGVAAWRDSFLYCSPNDVRHRVFVSGKAIHVVRTLFDVIPVMD
jgi:hypothetical protein